MLRLQGGQMESLWDEVLPKKPRELPEDLAQIDALAPDEALLSPIEAHRDREAQPMLELLPPPTQSGLPRAFIRGKSLRSSITRNSLSSPG